MNMSSRFFLVGFTAGAAMLAGGCATDARIHNPAGAPVTEMKPDERGPGPESQDIATVTDKMARSILAIPEIGRAQAAPTVVLEPVVNNTRFPINKELLLTHIRSQLNSKGMGRVDFLDREMMKTLQRDRELKRAGQVTANRASNAVESTSADFFLTGQLDGNTTKAAAGINDYVRYTLRLTDARTSRIVWEDNYEMNKQGLEMPLVGSAAR